ncbi:MAG: hypothetical protein KC425_14885 [Anaerolineales bacterium]|nr:hypothetical protein [Anaerolineales bacterium]
MTAPTLFELQASVQDKAAFRTLDDYYRICQAFLDLLSTTQPTRIVSPNDFRYVFFQFDERHAYRITRPLNSDLFIHSVDVFRATFSRFFAFLADLKRFQHTGSEQAHIQKYLVANEVNQVVYTIQQAIGSIGDSFENPNQARKRIGQLFENLIKLIIKEVGFACESRTIFVPLPDSPDYSMSYELDLVFSNKGAILASETELVHPLEVVGSVKTTSKDRLDKIFLDKFMLSRLLGYELKVIAIFLHDVQRARKGKSIFGINPTFKTNHFLGYTLALNRLNGVYYVDPRPEMQTDPRLSSEIRDFQHFLTTDIWQL